MKDSLLATSLLVGLGGALGSMARYWCSLTTARFLGETFPYGTLLVNVVGSFAIGLFFTLSGADGRWLVGPGGRLFFMVGVCGGFTTFSSFSLQTLNLLREGQWLSAALNVLGSLALCLAAVWLGHIVAARLNAP